MTFQGKLLRYFACFLYLPCCFFSPLGPRQFGEERRERDQVAERRWPNSSCPDWQGLRERSKGGALLSLSTHCGRILLCACVSLLEAGTRWRAGPPLLGPLHGGIWRGMEAAAGSGCRRVQHIRVWVPAPTTDYFLECGLFPRSPSISITVCGVSWPSTWRRMGGGQGSTGWVTKEGREVGGSSKMGPSGRGSRCYAPASPCCPWILLQREDLVMGDHTSPSGLDSKALTAGEGDSNEFCL